MYIYTNKVADLSERLLRLSSALDSEKADKDKVTRLLAANIESEAQVVAHAKALEVRVAQVDTHAKCLAAQVADLKAASLRADLALTSGGGGGGGGHSSGPPRAGAAGGARGGGGGGGGGGEERIAVMQQQLLDTHALLRVQTEVAAELESARERALAACNSMQGDLARSVQRQELSDREHMRVAATLAVHVCCNM